MSPGRMTSLRAAWTIAWLALSPSAFAADEPGSKDHALIGRYEGASIAFYKASDFDEEALLQAPHDFGALLERDAVADRSGPEWLRLEGRITRICYEIPAGRSSLEVFRNYQTALKKGGFEFCSIVPINPASSARCATLICSASSSIPTMATPASISIMPAISSPG